MVISTTCNIYKDDHVYIARSTYHHAYSRQTQVDWKKETKERKEDKGQERKDKKAKNKKERRGKKRQGNRLSWVASGIVGFCRRE